MKNKYKYKNIYKIITIKKINTQKIEEKLRMKSFLLQIIKINKKIITDNKKIEKIAKMF